MSDDEHVDLVGRRGDQAPGAGPVPPRAAPVSQSPFGLTTFNRPMPKHKALKHHWNFVAIIFLMFNLGATALYFKVRIEKLIAGEQTIFWWVACYRCR
jgi:hypothetical protein